jgi:hypothetical protein
MIRVPATPAEFADDLFRSAVAAAGTIGFVFMLANGAFQCHTSR